MHTNGRRETETDVILEYLSWTKENGRILLRTSSETGVRCLAAAVAMILPTVPLPVYMTESESRSKNRKQESVKASFPQENTVRTVVPLKFQKLMGKESRGAR